MGVLVLSCGRSGTNLVLEILRTSNQLEATKVVEDKDIFLKTKMVSKNYLSKSDTHYCRIYENIDIVMKKNPSLKIVWTIRDPKDMILSKIHKGQKGMDGNYEIADDATPDGCIEDIEHMFSVYNYFLKNYEDRIYVVKMEDVISKFEETIKNLCNFIGINYSDQMKNFSFRNENKAKRYNGLDQKQINTWARRKTIYNNFFTQKDYKIEYIAEKINHITKYFNYETFNNS